MEKSDLSLALLQDLLHELRDPFSAIFNGLELHSTKSALSDIERQRLDASLRRNSLTMKQVFDEASLLLLMLGEAKGQPARPAEVSEILKSAAAEIGPQLESRSQTVNIVSPQLTILVDAGALRSCLTCLLGSVSRVCSHGETLEMSVSQQSEHQLTFKIAISGRQPRPRTNSLSGYREELALLLSGRLQGLLVREFLDGWTLELPFQKATQELKPESAMAPKAGKKRLKILVVDDNIDAADTLSLWLEAKGFDVLTAYDGNLGLAEFERFHPDFGLFDVGLPKRSGYDLAEEVRRQGFAGTLVAITGYGQEKDKVRAREAGFDHHLVKPVDLQALAQLIDKHTVPKVLVVEDNPVVRRVMTTMLIKVGAEATSVGTAEEALSEIFHQPPDLILCDLGLPGRLNGFDLAQQVRRQLGNSLSLIAVTGDATGARQRALKSGFDDVLEKPVDQATLQKLVFFGPAES